MPIATPTFARQNQVNDQGQQCKNHQIKELSFVYHMTSITPSDVDLAAQTIGQLWGSRLSVFVYLLFLVISVGYLTRVVLLH